MSLMVISSIGAFLATIVKITLNHTLTDEQILNWGWRIPFWFGILLLLLGWYSKSALKRTPVFEQMIHEERNRNVDQEELNNINGNIQDDNIRSDSDFTLSRYMRHQHDDNSQYEIIPKNPFTIACCHNFPLTITFILATAMNHLIPYLFNVFLPDYLDSVAMHGWSDEKSYQFNAYLMIIASALIIAVGVGTDKYGPMRFLITSAVLTFLMSPIVWYLFTITTEPWQDFLLSLSFAIIPNITCGAVYFWYIDVLLTDPRTRTRIFGVAYNIGAVLFAGTAPFLGTFFIETNGRKIGSVLTGCWVSLTALFSLTGYLFGQYGLPKNYVRFDVESEFNEEQQELTAPDNQNKDEDD